MPARLVRMSSFVPLRPFLFVFGDRSMAKPSPPTALSGGVSTTTTFRLKTKIIFKNKDDCSLERSTCCQRQCAVRPPVGASLPEHLDRFTHSAARFEV